VEPIIYYKWELVFKQAPFFIDVRLLSKLDLAVSCKCATTPLHKKIKKKKEMMLKVYRHMPIKLGHVTVPQY
jgi:hypothetical protein